MLKLDEVYSNQAVEAFGFALRLALRKDEDYASLIELENAETPEDFSEVVKKFLRRYESNARKYEKESGKGAFRPTENHLDDLMKLAQENTRLVRAALISHALVKSTKEKEEGE